MSRGPIINGKDFNFFAKIDVTNTEFTSNAQVVFNFRNQIAFSLVNEGSAIIEYSFNGNTLHGDMTLGTPTTALIFDNRRVSKIWFRVPGGGSHRVRVEAWAAV